MIAQSESDRGGSGGTYGTPYGCSTVTTKIKTLTEAPLFFKWLTDCWGPAPLPSSKKVVLCFIHGNATLFNFTHTQCSKKRVPGKFWRLSWVSQPGTLYWNQLLQISYEKNKRQNHDHVQSNQTTMLEFQTNPSKHDTAPVHNQWHIYWQYLQRSIWRWKRNKCFSCPDLFPMRTVARKDAQPQYSLPCQPA